MPAPLRRVADDDPCPTCRARADKVAAAIALLAQTDVVDSITATFTLGCLVRTVTVVADDDCDDFPALAEAIERLVGLALGDAEGNA